MTKKTHALICIIMITGALFAQTPRITLTNISILSVRSDATEKPYTGFNYIRNESNLTLSTVKFNFTGRIRFQMQPTNIDRTFNNGVTFLMGMGEDGSNASRGFMQVNTNYIRATLWLRPFESEYAKALEFAVGTNINYYSGTTTDWSETHWSDTVSGSRKVTEYLPRFASSSNALDSPTSGTDYFASNGNRAWGERGFAVKYGIGIFNGTLNGGVFLDMPQLSNAGNLAAIYYRAGLQYNLPKVFSVGTVWKGNTLQYSQQAWGITTTLNMVPNSSINIWFNYNTANDSYVSSMLRNQSLYYANTFSQTNFVSFGISGSTKWFGITFSPDIAMSVLLGEDYKVGYYKNSTDYSRTRLAAELGTPFFLGLNISYPIAQVKGLTPELFVSYTQGALKENPSILVCVYPQVSYAFAQGTLTGAFAMRFNTPNNNAMGTLQNRTTYFGWEIPISWTMRF